MLPVALDSNPQSERKEDSLFILLFGEQCCAISYITIYVKITEAYVFFSNDFILTNVLNSLNYKLIRG